MISTLLHLVLLTVLCIPHLVFLSWVSDLDLPPSHIPYYFGSRKDLADHCLGTNCPYKDSLGQNKCFGYEKGCTLATGYQPRVRCPHPSRWPNARKKEDQEKVFWEQADFGYIRRQLDELTVICEETEALTGSSLKCTDHLRYCYATNIFFHFKSFEASINSNKYRNDIIGSGEVGGSCYLHHDRLQSRADHNSFLQSWAGELLPFTSIGAFRVNYDNCDIIYYKPTIIIKLDAGVSMYHHFCDFLNLYASQHINGSFNKDVQIVIWDTSSYGYHDLFIDTWKAFTDQPMVQIKDMIGKKVCFKEAMLPLLARMQYGMYYNMPLVDGCEGSGLFQAFSMHVMHRLRIAQHGPLLTGKIRVTLLSRSTKFRKVVNEQELISALKTISEFEVKVVDYSHKRMTLTEQFRHTHNSDIFIGMHGSGLTHLLFLPDWAAVFEIYNCDDPRCYFDLARLRGVKYFTWEKSNKVYPEDEGKHPQDGSPHAKFTNYAFDVEEFMRIVLLAADYVRSHPEVTGATNGNKADDRTEL